MPKRKTEGLEKAKLPEPYEATAIEEHLVKAYTDRRKQSGPAPKVKAIHQLKEHAQIEPDHPEPVIGYAALSAAFGTVQWSFAAQQLQALVNATHGNREAPVSEEVVNGALAAVNGVQAQDEVEAMLATQMVATNHIAMDLLRRSGQADYLNQANIYGNLAVKFLRTFTTQLETLQRYRGKGQQKIVVERVNVSEGGQAIVGAVERSGPGGGANSRSEEQSHAKSDADAPDPTLRREDQAGQAMSSTGGEG